MQNSRRILVIDDIPDWRTTLIGLLKGEGYQAAGAESTAEARTRLLAEKFDLALVDIRLDETEEGNDSGLLLAAEIRQRWPQTKIIFVTGYSSQEFIERAFMATPENLKLADNYIEKSNVENLLTMIHDCLK